MDQLALSPDRWLLGSPMVALGTLVILALIGGEATARVLRLPRIVGYAATGTALGALGVTPKPLTDELRLAIDFCLGIALFELGARIDLGWLKRAPRIACLAIAECAVVGASLYLALAVGLGLEPALAVCGAAIGVSSSPCVALRVSRDLSAQGQVTERMLMLSATNSAAAVFMLAGLLPALNAVPAAGLMGGIGRPLYVLLGSLLLAVCLANLGLATFRLLGKRREGQLVGALGLVMLGAGLATIWSLSPALVLLTLGGCLRVVDREQRMMALDFGRTGQLFYLLLFALIGASLDLRAAAGAAAAAVIFVAVRAAAKAVTVLVFAHATRQPLRKAALLALSLQPMSALAVVMAYQASLAQAELAAVVVPIVWAAVVVFQLVGPLCVQAALRWSGEAAPEAA